MTVTQVVLATISTSCFLALFAYILLITFGYGRTLHRSSSRTAKTFLCFVAIGFLVCLFEGATTMLYWMPDEWTSKSPEGEYTSLRIFIAAWFTLLGGTALLSRIEQAVCQEEKTAPFPPAWFGLATRSAPWSKSTKSPGDH